MHDSQHVTEISGCLAPQPNFKIEINHFILCPTKYSFILDFVLYCDNLFVFKMYICLR